MSNLTVSAGVHPIMDNRERRPPARLVISFCNLRVPGLALGLYDFEADRLDWLDLAGMGESCYGITGVCQREDGFWCLPQLAPNGRSGLLHVGCDGRVQGCWGLAHTGDAHHILPYQEGFLVTDTRRNRVNFLSFTADQRLLETEYWRGSDADTDQLHINSLVEFKGEIYVSQFGPLQSPGWAGAAGGQIVNISQGVVIHSGLAHPHSLAGVGETLFWLESGHGRLHSFSAGGEHQVLIELPGYLRGITSADDYLYVAGSAHRARSRSTGTLNPAMTTPDALRSWLYRVHLPTRQVERRQLTQWGPEIYDVALVPEACLGLPPAHDAWEAAVTRLWQLEEALGHEPDRLAGARALEASQRQIEALQRKHAEAVAALRGELTRAQSDIELMRRSKFWRLGGAYWRARARLAGWLRRTLPPPVKRGLRRLLRRQPQLSRAPAVTDVLDAGADFYSTLTLLPGVDPAQTAAILANTTLPPRRQPAVICFSIIDWSFRYQRPQQIMSQFGAAGHRVFYINLTRHLPAGDRAGFRVQAIKENVYELFLAAPRPLDVYSGVLASGDEKMLLDSLAALGRAYDLTEAVAYVMVPSWANVALEARRRWGWHVIYDCMDEWESFPGIGRSVVATEARLAPACDLLVVTAQRLYEKWAGVGRPLVLARNAVDFDFFAERLRPNALLAGRPHPLVGYYGAIADWFDVDLVRYLAENRPDYTFVLLGGVFDVDVSALAALPNVLLLGQQPYATMPEYLFHFDVCLIPFKINAITQATDPVKLYEYLSAGKPVVAVALAELEPYREHLYLARDRAEFLDRLDEAVSEDDPERARRRQALARANTWRARYEVIAAAWRAQVAPVSIIMVTYNNLALTRLCLESVLRNTAYGQYEVIVVDNHSSDGTPAYLQTVAAEHRHVRVICNDANHGFARANNQGLACATGDCLVLLNNDTVVPPGWLSRLLRPLQDQAVGLVGPMTNFAGNEARLEVTYRSWQAMEAFAHARALAHARQVADITVLAMYCVALRRDVFAAVGPLDEQYGLGLFEDDDYALRVRQAGYRVVCAADAFVHHFGQAAFGKLIAAGTYDGLFEANRRYFESKWNKPWVPHRHGRLDFTEHVPDAPEAAPPGPRPQPAGGDLTYAAQVLQEKKKWGEHLKVEATGDWHAWLDHPLVAAHYQERGLIDGQSWQAWVTQCLGGPAERSLDLGCGAGDRSLALSRLGTARYVEGVDLSDERVAEGERRRQAAGVPGRFWVEDANQLTLPANAYDLIFSCHSFHHFLQLEHLMTQVESALTPRGLFVLEEFVGPTQFQWTDAQMEHTRRLLGQLPPTLRRYRDGQLKVWEGRPTPEQVAAVSPFESIRSAEIWPLFQQHFEVVAVRNLGGTVQHLLYNGIVHNFRPEERAALQHMAAIFVAEDELIDAGRLPSDFRLLVGRKRANPAAAGHP